MCKGACPFFFNHQRAGKEERKFDAGGDSEGDDQQGQRKAYRPARRTRSLPAKKYGGEEREKERERSGGDFPYPVKIRWDRKREMAEGIASLY